jgi:SIR2-like domain
MGNKVEWGAPALFLNAGEGRLFDREKAAAARTDAPDDRIAQHFALVVRKFAEGKVIPFLGAAASFYDRPDGAACEPGKYLPRADELAQGLADEMRLSEKEKHLSHDLLRVSQYYSLILGESSLYDHLHTIFDGEYPIAPLHQLLADIPGLLKAGGHGERHLLIITTNYDDLLERAFQQAGEPFDLLYYEAKENPQERRGKFWHQAPGAERRLVMQPNQYLDVCPEERSVILKIHGAVDRRDRGADSYVITEDDYIDYLTRTEIATLLPVKLSDKIFGSHLLFLGYSLRDWNLRTILHRIERRRTLSYRSWAIQKNPPEVDKKFWSQRDVDILDMDLQVYVDELDRQMRGLPRAGGAG